VIVLVRVDNRLLHGQILEAWVPRLRISWVVVADDEASASPLARAAMTLCLPPELKADVLPVAGIDYAALASTEKRVLVLFRDVTTLSRAVAAGLTPALAHELNLGNVHFSPGRYPVTPSVFLSADEVAEVERLAKAGFAVVARAVPTDPPTGAREIAQKYTEALRKR
jgi:N-acetylgalactosamine PTS system EIIB component